MKEKSKPSRIRKFVNDSLIAISISLAFILLLEGVLRLFFPQNLSGTRITGETFSNRDKILGIRYTPGAKWKFSHPEYTVEYTINEHGFRDKKEHPSPKPEGTMRVLLVGDSFTFGQGVDYEQTWPVIIENRLSESGNNQIDLMKTGIQGMDTRSEFILIQRLLEKYECDVVVVGFLINDLYTNTLYGIDKNERMSTTKKLDGKKIAKKSESAGSWFKTMRNVFIRNDKRTNFHLLNLARRLAISSDKIFCNLYLAAPQRAGWLTTPLPPRAAKKLEITMTIFEKMAAYCHALGKKLIVLSIPQQFQVLYSDESIKSRDVDVALYDHYFSDVATQNDFNWISTLDAFTNSSYKKDELFYRLDGHLTPTGHQIVAHVFLKKIIPLLNDTLPQLR